MDDLEVDNISFYFLNGIDSLIGSNFFIPQMKLVKRIRENGYVKKVCEFDTPLNRILKLEELSEDIKIKLKRIRQEIDIVKLSESIEELSEALNQAYEKKLRRYKSE